ncbi:putative cytosol aminopeptidase [Pseudovibrio axinellae]|uniref:Putative cytosol aminopeptidase n=1 Tax=Pseudovibrio axinellae TaxID=989403 RepID=A0A166B7H2_9HYPH|nr:leucyl aminopeptidase family protein [Pseudovibrio axinellae]KZL21986.1 putative cytosol aminopeptidase [Pseudovibrio axinellae]SEQ59725.1 leucyl aminopeptidase [Pseudovibrio axinellae]
MHGPLISASEKVNPTPVVAILASELEVYLNTAGALAKAWVSAQGFEASFGETLSIPSASGEIETVLFGCGHKQSEALETGAALSKSLPAGAFELSTGFDEIAGIALGFALASYRFDAYKDVAAAKSQLVIADESILEELAPIVAGTRLAKDLINTPANDMGPEELTAAATQLFDEHGGTSKVIIGSRLETEFPLVHAVGNGSDRAPRLVDAIWGKDTDTKITLVGKGVIFDSGGLDVKPAAGMILMKKDMGGAANVLGLAAMIMKAKLPVRLRVIIPAVENAISGRSFRPSDIFKSRKGLTVEIGNTDAEGRLVLADALALADEESPELIIDMATLTGAARVALGPDLPPYYTDDEELAETIAVHSEAVNDPLWRLPLWKPYKKYITSKTADLANINTSGAGFAGSITAALFLQRFVENAGSWAHFDIYGWTPIEKDFRTHGGEAQAIRALFDTLKTRFG